MAMIEHGDDGTVKREQMLGYSELEVLIHIPRGTLYAWVHQRSIPHIRLGPRLVRFRLSEVLAWLEERRVVVAGGAGR